MRREHEDLFNAIETFKNEVNKLANATVSINITIENNAINRHQDKLKEFILLIENNYKGRYKNFILSSKNRRSVLVNYRIIYAKIAKLLGYTLKDIGYVINRGHPDIVYYNNKANDLLETDPKFRMLYNDVVNLINRTKIFKDEGIIKLFK